MVCSSSFPRAQKRLTPDICPECFGSAAAVAHNLIHVEADDKCQTSGHIYDEALNQTLLSEVPVCAVG